MNVAFSLDKKAISAELKVHQYAEGDLAGLRNLMAAVIRFEHPENEQMLLKLIDLVNEISERNPERKRTFAIWIRAVLLR